MQNPYAQPEPPRYNLSLTSRFIDPFWLNTVRHQTLPATVEEDGRHVVVKGNRLKLDQPLPPGTELYCNFAGHFTAEPKALVEARCQQAAEAAEANRQKQERLHEQSRQTFWDKHTPEFKFSVAHFEMLSGLSEHSSGNGATSATVTHLIALEDAKVGRLERKEGQALCGAKSTRAFKAPWLYQDGGKTSREPAFGKESFKPAKPTCAKCCEVLERMNRAHRLRISQPWERDGHWEAAVFRKEQGSVHEGVVVEAPTRELVLTRARNAKELAAENNLSCEEAGRQAQAMRLQGERRPREKAPASAVDKPLADKKKIGDKGLGV